MCSSPQFKKAIKTQRGATKLVKRARCNEEDAKFVKLGEKEVEE